MSKYDKEIAISREEEGSYHRREITDCVPASSSNRPSQTTYHTERYLVPKSSSSKSRGKQIAAYSSDEDEKDNYEEWTTSKRKINHTTRQVETRVSRQLLVEDGKVIADSGPQVTTRIKEDNKIEECEKEKTPKNKKGFEALENAPEVGGGEGGSSGRVLGEKKEIQRVSHEVREENMQYHDERFKELSGKDVHRKAIKAPHELMTIQDDHERYSKGSPRGKMVHYSNKGKKYQDTDEILEVAKLAIDGSVTKEVKRTRHHEEFSEDEKPDEKGEAEALRQKPIVERSSRKHVDYVNDFDDTATPDSSDVEQHSSSRQRSSGNKLKSLPSSSSARKHQRDKSAEEAFPRYEIDPLLNSLRDEDFKPIGGGDSVHRGRHIEHSPVMRQRASSSSSSAASSRSIDRKDYRSHNYHYNKSAQPVQQQQQWQQPVEIPEEYRVNKQRLMSSKSSSSGGRRSQSPAQIGRSNKSGRTQSSRREDASVQARLTDEEGERHSQLSSTELDSHEKTTRYLQRQSTPNSSRHYYYGESRHNNTNKNLAATKQRKTTTAQEATINDGTNNKRRVSISSSSSSASSANNDRGATITRRKNGTISRDSGFRSPAQRAQTPSSDIYSISSKARKQQQQGRVGSPTPSVGQRSVKTTTTTMSAGLKERPLSPEHTINYDNDDFGAGAKEPNRPMRSKTTTKQSSKGSTTREWEQQQQQQQQRRQRQQKSDKVSRTPSPFQKIADFFRPKTNKEMAAAR